MDGIVISAELESALAIRATFTHEFLEQSVLEQSARSQDGSSHVLNLDQRAHHAGAQIALLVWRNEERHEEGDVKM